MIAASPVLGKYDDAVDRESAYEMLAARKSLPSPPAQGASSAGGLGGILGRITDALGGGGGQAGADTTKGKGRQPMSITEMVVRSAVQSFARSASTQIAREGGRILRNQLGGILGGR